MSTLVIIDRGFLQVQLKGHKHRAKVLQYRAKRLADGEWHHLRLSKLEREVRLQVDELPAETMNYAPPKVKVTRKRMYIGGVPSKIRRTYDVAHVEEASAGGSLPPSFTGCIRSFTINSREYNLFSVSRDVLPCTHSRDVTYIHDGGFLLFG